jgi:DNA polymerase III subunit delta
MTPDQVRKQLAGKISPAYVVAGISTFEIERYVKMIRDAALSGGFADLNFDAFDAGDDKFEFSKVSKIARTFPMMARMRVILIRRAEELDAESLAGLNGLARENIETCCLIAQGEKFDKRTAFAKLAKDNDALWELGKPKADQVRAWTKIMAEERSRTLSPEAAEFLADQWGGDLAAIEKEIEKAALYADPDSATIEASDISAVMVAPKVDSVFDLTDAVGEKNRPKALYFLNGMLDALDPKKAPLQVNALLTNHVRKILRAREMLDSGMDRETALRTLGGHPFAAGKVLDQARKYTSAELRRGMLVLSRTDFELKNGRLNDRIILERAILNLCGSSGVL